MKADYLNKHNIIDIHIKTKHYRIRLFAKQNISISECFFKCIGLKKRENCYNKQFPKLSCEELSFFLMKINSLEIIIYIAFCLSAIAPSNKLIFSAKAYPEKEFEIHTF